jgi:hypothetical protein
MTIIGSVVATMRHHQGLNNMITANQQLGARIRFMKILASAIAPIHAVPAKTWALQNIAFPALGGAFALPDYSGLTEREIRDVIAADYDRKNTLPKSYYKRDTSHWAGR